MLELYLYLDNLISPDLPPLNQLRDSDDRRTNGVIVQCVVPLFRSGCAPSPSLGNRNRLARCPTPVAGALGNDPHSGGAAVHTGLNREIGMPIGWAQVED